MWGEEIGVGALVTPLWKITAQKITALLGRVFQPDLAPGPVQLVMTRAKSAHCCLKFEEVRGMGFRVGVGVLFSRWASWLF